MSLTLISADGTERPVCDVCHRVRVKIRKGKTVCVKCKDIDANGVDWAAVRRVADEWWNRTHGGRQRVG